MVDILAAGHAKVIGYTAFFFEPQVDAGLVYFHKIAGLLGKSSLLEGGGPENAGSDILAGALLAASSVSPASAVSPVVSPASMVAPAAPAEPSPLDALLLEAASNLDNDKKRSERMARANDVLLAL